MASLADSIDVFDVLEKLGMDNVKPASGGSEAHYSCPFPGHAHGDEKPSAYMNVETTAWFCWGCKERGRSVVSFVAKVMSVPYAIAESWLREAYGVEFKEPDGGSMVAEMARRFAPPAVPVKLRAPSLSWQFEFVAGFHGEHGARARKYMIGRGFDLDTMVKWGIGYDVISDRVTIPIHDQDGMLVGFKARALREGQEPRYWVMGDMRSHAYGFDPYEAAEVVFGLHLNHHIDYLVLCEGELNAMALAQFGIMRPCALGMSYMTDRHAQLITSQVREVIVFFDSDKAGQAGLMGHQSSSGARLPGIVEKLLPHVTLKVVPDHEGDPASMKLDQAIALITNARSVIAA